MTSFILFSVLIFASLSCGKKVVNANTSERNISPLLNSSFITELQTRGSGEYALSCLFLNEYAKKHNDCAILLQNDDSIHAVQVTDDVGSFKALVRESNHNFESGNQLNDLGESLRAGTYSVGDEYLLVKSDSETKYKLTFKILEIKPRVSIKIEYQIKEYNCSI